MILGILLIALALRLIQSNQSIWLDEGAQLTMSSGSLHSIFFERGGDFHPPLSYLLTHLWMQLGVNEVWLRLLPIFFGVGTIWALYKIAYQLFNRQIALLSAGLLSIAPYHIYYSQELRMYSQLTFFTALSNYLFIQGRQKTNLKGMIGYILVTAAVIYTHYIGLLLLVTQLLFILWYRRDKVGEFILATLCVGLLWLPWLPQFLKQLSFGVRAEMYLPGWSSVLSISGYKSLLLTFLKFSIGRIDFDNDILYGAIAIVVFIIFGHLLYLGIRNLKSLEQRFILFWLGLPILLTMFISLKIPMFQPFRLLFVIPAFYLLLAVGIWHINKLRLVRLVIVCSISLISLMFYFTTPRFQREDWRAASFEIAEKSTSNSIVIFGWSKPFDPYLWYVGNDQTVAAVATFPAQEKSVTASLDRYRERREVYLFEYLQPLADPNKEIQKWIERNGYVKHRIYNYQGVGFVSYYQK